MNFNLDDEQSVDDICGSSFSDAKVKKPIISTLKEPSKEIQIDHLPAPKALNKTKIQKEKPKVTKPKVSKPRDENTIEALKPQNIKQTRSGRTVMKPLEYWKNEKRDGGQL